MPAKQEGLINTGLHEWQEFNKKELLVEGIGIIVGVGLGIPWLTALAATAGTVNGVQMVGIHEVQKRRENAKTVRSVPMQRNKDYAL